MKKSGPSLGRKQVRAESKDPSDPGLNEVSRSKYHDQNILLGLGMSSQGMSEEVRQVAHVELANDRRQNETVRPTDHATDSLFKGPKQGSATLSIDRCRIASIGAQEHS